jgi:uncharacterized C2H2 Zn-finger protein
MEYALKADIAKLKAQMSGRKVENLPTCGKCGRLALRDGKEYDRDGKCYVTCPACGYHGPAGPSFGIMIKEA